MSLLIDYIFEGILTGGVYALMASGLTLVFGVMDIINIAQGAMVILGAYLSYALEQHLHLDLFIGLLLTVPFMFVLGVVIQWLFIRPLKQDRTSLSILVTFAVAIIIEGVLTAIFSETPVALHAVYIDSQSFYFAGYYFANIYIYGLLLSIGLLAGLYLLLYRTKFGFSVRASMQNRTAAELIGINVNQISAITFGIGVALTAAGGMVYGAVNIFSPNSSYDLISRLLTIIILGGMGSLSGALIASLGVIVVYDVTAGVYSATWASIAVYAIMIAVLVLRPQGLLGKLEGRKQ